MTLDPAGPLTTAQIIPPLVALARSFAGARSPDEADGSTPLAEGGFWLESATLFELVLACEERFAVSLDPDDDLTSEGLATVGSLAERICLRRAAS